MTDDRQTDRPRYGEMCSNRRNRLRCKSDPGYKYCSITADELKYKGCPVAVGIHIAGTDCACSRGVVDRRILHPSVVDAN